MKAILVINSGSSTVKFSVFAITSSTEIERKYHGIVDQLLTYPIFKIAPNDAEEEKISEEITVSGDKENYYKQAIEHILQWVKSRDIEIVAAGHRIVHGGPKYFTPLILNAAVVDDLLSLSPIMPLHQPFNIKGVKVLQQELPNIIQVGCFDTAFHVTCHEIWKRYAIPNHYFESGVRRYGFHGLSYEYISEQLPNGKFVVAHLGNGATMCAIKDKKSWASSIGMTGIGGLPMGTRCDSLDPGAVLYIMENYGLSTEQMRQLMYKECGLLGVSEVSSDMRTLLTSDKPSAKLAIDIFINRIVIIAGSLAAELEGMDGFVFTGGIGENAFQIREQVCKKLSWLNLSIDAEKNQQKIKQKHLISNVDSAVKVWVMPTDEETMIARHTFKLLQ